jgi:Cytotoxic translational repressor of toxin-antitoxin stability system
MNVEFDKSFSKSLDKLKDASVAHRLIGVIEQVEKASSIESIKNIKKMVGYRDYYRIRIGDYRVGFELVDEQTVLFILICHRKDIYKRFP